MYKARIQQAIQESVAVKEQLLADSELPELLEKAAECIVGTLRQGGKVHFCGNGGSAADAQHLAAELSGRFYVDRPPLNAEALHCNTSYLTAVGNDYGYDHVFSRLLRGTGRKGDVMVGISTSGNSKNIVNACSLCKEMGITVMAFTGKNGGMMRELADFLFAVPSTDTPRIQESHILLGHMLCELVERMMFPESFKER